MNEYLSYYMNSFNELIYYMNGLVAGGRGTSVSACADLTDQLHCCWVDPACAWKKH